MKPTTLLPLDPADHRRLLGIARGLLGSQADAEDAVHDVYLRTLVAPPSGLVAPLAWLTTLVKHRAVDHLRHRRLEAGLAESKPGGAVIASVEDEAQRSQRQVAAVRHLADTLQPAEAAMLLLREVFEFSHAVIAERAGKSEAACRQTVHRALLRLRQAQQGGEPDDRDTADALHTLCLRALQTCSPAPLFAILASPVSACAGAGAGAGAGSAPVPGLSSGVLQVDGGFALVLVHEGRLLCSMPLGPLQPTCMAVDRMACVA